MKRKELLEKTGLEEKIFKFWLRNKYFVPEKQTKENGPIDYTENDIVQLQSIEILHKAGFEFPAIRKLLDNPESISSSFKEHREKLQSDLSAIKSSLELMIPLCNNSDRFGKELVSQLMFFVKLKEEKGAKFAEPEEYTWDGGYNLFVQSVACPFCHVSQNIDLEDYVISQCSDECPMGPDTVIEVESESDSITCIHCGSEFGVKGWMREYPIGAYDSSELEVFQNEEEKDDE